MAHYLQFQTVIVTQNMLACRLPQYVKDPLKFKPERWMRESTEYEKFHPFMSLPFGFGPRSCIARRLAEQNISITLMRVTKHKFIYNLFLYTINAMLSFNTSVGPPLNGRMTRLRRREGARPMFCNGRLPAFMMLKKKKCERDSNLRLLATHNGKENVNMGA